MTLISKEERICPQCNGLTQYVQPCPKCPSTMIDGGKVEDYYDNYSPYLPQLSSVTDTNECTHLYYCPNCGYDKRISIEKKEV